jgi:hypothetical protein
MERTHVPWPIGLPVPVKQDRSPKMRPYYSRAYGPIFVCDMPGRKPLLPQIAARADLSQMLVKAVGPAATKMAPENRGHFERIEGLLFVGSRLCAEILYLKAQRPKRGRSPLRMAMRLLAVSRRSIEAITRPNRVLEGRRLMDAVLDMFVPFLMRNHSAS